MAKHMKRSSTSFISRKMQITTTVRKSPYTGQIAAAAKWLQLCLSLRDPMDCSPPGSSVHGILQARILEWVVMPTSRGSS